ncbi:MAG TPA: hypothetical protein VFP00_10510 [Burkholderiales bacterium]|nr:hypothetical protein [Burkholderiales bacterium]
MAATSDSVAEQSGCASSHGRRLKSRILRLSGGVLLLGLLCALSPAMAAAPVEITAVVGFADTFQPGRWTPLHVSVTNRGGDLSGELEVQVTGGDELSGRRFVTAHRRKLELQRNSTKNLQFTILPQGLSHPLVIRALSNGLEQARLEIDLRTRSIAERLLLVLSRDADLDYLNEGTAQGLRVLYPHPELLPVHWRGYDAVAAVVLHGISLERLSASQFEALHKWIAQGGTLAVSGGPDYTLLRRPRLAQLLPGLPVGMMRIDGDALRAAFSTSLDISRPVYINRLNAYRGDARLLAGEQALIVERALGLGRVLYLTFDVASHPFDRWDGMGKLWEENLRLAAATAVFPSGSKAAAESPVLALIRAESADFPWYVAVFIFLALYLGTLLAGYRFPVRGTPFRRLAPLWAWGAPAIFAPAAWLMFGPAAFPRGPASVTVAVIEPFPDSTYARLNVDLGVYASRRGPLRLEYRGAEPALYPPYEAVRRGKVPDWVLGEGPQRFVEPRDRRRYVLHALEGADVIAFRIDAAVHDEITGPRVVLENSSGSTIEALWLVFGGHAYELGTIADGARIDRSLVRSTHGIEVGAKSWREVLRPPADAPARDVTPARIALERRAQETDQNGYPSPGHALLVGYAASPLRPAGDSAGWPHRARAVVSFQVRASPASDRSKTAQQPGKRNLVQMRPVAIARESATPQD